ncbi:hypothetical protein OAK19_05425 [Aureispira]|nr:hypothetical protein [Aureispira sp.]
MTVLPIVGTISTLSQEIDFKTDNIRLYLYNPSIDINANNDFIVIARITGSTFSKCDQNSTVIDDNEISNYFDLFQNKKNSASGLILYNINTLEYKLINPFYTEDNVSNFIHQGYEDPRIFTYNSELWIITYFRGVLDNKFQHKIIIFPIANPENYIFLNYDKQRNNKNFLNIISFGSEKNWMPFEWNNNLYIVYSIFPHIILQVDMKTGNCIEIAKTFYNKPNFIFKGGIGNGAPPKLFFHKNISYFLGIGHNKNSYKGDFYSNIRKNFFYIFEAKSPFQIVKVSNEFNIYQDFVPIEYASGLIIDEEHNHLYISLGINDCHELIVQYYLSDILNFIGL